MAIDNGTHFTNHVPSPYDPHYPGCVHAPVCPHCGAPKVQPQPFYPWWQVYPQPYQTVPYTITVTNT